MTYQESSDELREGIEHTASPLPNPTPSNSSPDGPPDLPYSGELLRKALHLLALIIPAGMMMFGSLWTLALVVPAAVVAVIADVLRVRSRTFARFVNSVFGVMMRPDELPRIGARPVLNGATWVLISAALLAVLFPIDLAAPAFASFMVADAAAAITGLRWGRTRWAGTRRTVEGSAAFVVAAYLCLMPFDHITLPAAASVAILGAALEIPDWPINDNIRVPMIMSFTLLIWSL